MKISTPTSINCMQTPSTLAQALKSQFGFGEERWIYNLVKMFPHFSAYKGRFHKGSFIYRLSPYSFHPNQSVRNTFFNVMQAVCLYQFYLSRLMGKQTICLGENKGADQLRGNRKADQRLCFRYSDSTIPLLLKSEL